MHRRNQRGDAVAAVASTNVFVYNRRSEIVETTMRNGGSLYDYDWQGNRLSSTNGATGVVYAPDGLNQQATGRQDDGTTGTSASRPAPVEQSTPVDTRRLKV